MAKTTFSRGSEYDGQQEQQLWIYDRLGGPNEDYIEGVSENSGFNYGLNQWEGLLCILLVACEPLFSLAST